MTFNFNITTIDAILGEPDAATRSDVLGADAAPANELRRESSVSREDVRGGRSFDRRTSAVR